MFPIYLAIMGTNLTCSSRHFFYCLVKVPSFKWAAHANLRVDGRVVPWDAPVRSVEQGESVGDATLQHACTLYLMKS